MIVMQEIFDFMADCIAIYMIGCILTGSSLRNFYKNFVLFFLFAFLHIEMTYSTGSRICYYYSQVEGIVQIVLQLFFFFAIFYHSEDTFFEIPQLFRKENKFINVLYLFAFADSLTTVVHIFGSFMFFASVMSLKIKDQSLQMNGLWIAESKDNRNSIQRRTYFIK